MVTPEVVTNVAANTIMDNRRTIRPTKVAVLVKERKTMGLACVRIVLNVVKAGFNYGSWIYKSMFPIFGVQLLNLNSIGLIMKKHLLVLITTIIALGTQAQSTVFTCTSTCDTVSNIYVGEYYSFYIILNNETPDSLAMKWRVVENTLKPTWDFSLCDNNVCYFSIPDSAVMNPFAAGATAFLALNIGVISGTGEGVLTLWVSEVGNPGNGDTVSFTMNALQPTGLSSPSPTVFTLRYTSPTVLSAEGDAGEVHLMNLLGQTMLRSTKPAGTYPIDVSSLSAGTYIVAFTSKDGDVISDKLIRW